jgi:hypothetical protein
MNLIEAIQNNPQHAAIRKCVEEYRVFKFQVNENGTVLLQIEDKGPARLFDTPELGIQFVRASPADKERIVRNWQRYQAIAEVGERIARYSERLAAAQAESDLLTSSIEPLDCEPQPAPKKRK